MQLPKYKLLNCYIAKLLKKEKQFNNSTIQQFKTAGFSFIELLTAIAIIAILTAVVTASFTKAQQKARDGKRKADLKSIQQALELFFQDVGSYPAGPQFIGKIYCDPTGGGSYLPVEWGTKFECDTIQDDPPVNTIIVTFMNPLPKEQTNASRPYRYQGTAASGIVILSYRLDAYLENTSDPEYCADLDCTDSTGVQLPCQPSSGYNYCVVNP